MYWILPTILTAMVLFLTFAYNQNNRPDITAYDMSAPGAPACTVVHLSDLHSKPSARILNETAAQKPDIICITGDYINDKNRMSVSIRCFIYAVRLMPLLWSVRPGHKGSSYHMR